MNYIKTTIRDFLNVNENKNTHLIVYHGGENELSNDVMLDNPIFTTLREKDAMWYVHAIGGGFLTKMAISISNPLFCNSKEDFIKKWIPMLDESGVDYKFKDYGDSWSFESFDIIKNGGYIENNIYDLVYIDDFIDVVKKYGYDGIIGSDELVNRHIEVCILFYKENINIISSKLVK